MTFANCEKSFLNAYPTSLASTKCFTQLIGAAQCCLLDNNGHELSNPSTNWDFEPLDLGTRELAQFPTVPLKHPFI